MSYVFVFRASPDIDHMAPVAWKLLEEGEEVHAVLSTGTSAEGDHRLELLQEYPGFQMHRARLTLVGALLFLRRVRAGMLAVEWGYGVPPGYDAPLRPLGLAAVARTFGRSLLRRGNQRTRGDFIAAAALLRVPTVCLPHGLNIKLDPHKEVLRSHGDIELDWDDRNRFAAYVLNTEHHRRWHLDHTEGDPSVMQNWGSVRWAPEWFELNRRLAPDFAWPEAPNGRVKVVFMLPRWKRGEDGSLEWGPGVNGEQVMELVRSVHRLPEASLAVAAHPRADPELDPIRGHAGIDSSRVHDVSGTNSVSLIEAADIVIDAGSSIGLEVVLQGKVLLDPAFLYASRTLFDAIPSTCVVAQSVEEATDYVRAHAGGTEHRPSDHAVEELMRRSVYAGRKDPFDVLGEYVSRVRALKTG